MYISTYRMLLVSCSAILWRFQLLETDTPRLKTTENATKTQNTTQKTYVKLSWFTFLTLYQHLGSKSAQFCVLWSIFIDRVRELRNKVNVWDHMSRLTSRYLEQFGWSARLSKKSFFARGRPLCGQKRLAPLAKRSTCSKSNGLPVVQTTLMKMRF